MNLNYYFFIICKSTYLFWLRLGPTTPYSQNPKDLFFIEIYHNLQSFFLFTYYEYFYPLPEVRNFRIKALNSLGWFCCRATITFRTCFWTHFVHGWIQRPLNISGATPEKCNKYGNKVKVIHYLLTNLC